MTFPILSGTSSFYALIGHPVNQVRSPTGFNTYLTERNINAAMVTFDLLPESIGGFFTMLRGWGNCLGCCVTIPHKNIAFELVDQTTNRAKRIGAINIIRREKSGKLLGDMTDGLGFINALQSNGLSVTGKNIGLIGGGGAGSAIADAIAEANAKHLSIVEIDPIKGDMLISKLKKQYPTLSLDNAINHPENIDILINSSPIGMNSYDPLPISLAEFRSKIMVADSITEPNFTPFLRHAKNNGCFIQKGNEMADAQLPIFIDFLGIPSDKVSP